MTYSALIFDSCLDEIEYYKNLEKWVELYQKDPQCSQIVVNCDDDWMLKLAMEPKAKTMYVKTVGENFEALLNGLKAVTQDVVLITGLSKCGTEQEIEAALNEMTKYPAIYVHEDLQAFDTRLLMFCLQRTIEKNVNFESYMDVVQLLDTPIKKVEVC